MQDGMNSNVDGKNAKNIQECIICVFCGKSSVVNYEKFSMKRGNPMTLGLVSHRLCLGRHGFPRIGEPSPLVDHIDTHKKYINQLCDQASGIIMFIYESEIYKRIDTPPIILLLEEKNEEIKELKDRVNDLSFKLNDAKGKNVDAIPELQSLREKVNDLSFKLNDAKKKLSEIIPELENLRISARNHQFVVDDLNSKLQQKQMVIDSLKAGIQEGWKK